MKRYLSLLILVVLAACDFGDTNVDPNNPTDAPLPNLLSASEVTLAYTAGAEPAIWAGMFTQQIGGISLQSYDFDRYNVNDNFIDLTWNTLYAGAMNDFRYIIDKAARQTSPHYSGVAKILLATSLGLSSDMFGDIPYSEAFGGSSVLAPKYDSQEFVYGEIQRLLDEGIAELSESSSTLSPAADDLFYAGNREKWIAAAYTLKARYYLHTTKINAQDAARNALQALFSGNTTGAYRGIAGNANDLQMNFGTAPTEANPWYQYGFVARPNEWRLGKAFVDLLNGNGTDVPVDPRREFFAVEAGPGLGYSGVPAGQGALPASRLGPFYGSANSPVPLITYVEAKFMEAEARLILDENDPAAQAALTDAIRASFDKVGAGATPAAGREAYLAARGTLSGSFQQKLATLITQKYIALFTQFEVWNDWRRTGYPVLSPALGGNSVFNPNGEIPRRLPYAQSEKTTNPNIPTTTPSLQEPRLWWDR